LIFLKMGLKFKNIIDNQCGIRFIFEKLNLSSSLSRAELLEKK